MLAGRAERWREGRGDRGEGTEETGEHALTSEKRMAGVDGNRLIVESVLDCCVLHRKAFLQVFLLLLFSVKDTVHLQMCRYRTQINREPAKTGGKYLELQEQPLYKPQMEQGSGALDK